LSKTRSTSVFVKGAVLFTALALTVWCVPRGPKTPENWFHSLLSANQTRVKPYIHSFMYWSGLWQVWNMFSHDPDSYQNAWYNRYVYYEVEFKDGTKQRFDYPRMNEMGQLARALNLRFQKYVEVTHPKVHGYLMPRFSEVLAREFSGKHDSEPVGIKIFETWEQIGAPGFPNSVFPDNLFFQSRPKAASLNSPDKKS